MGDAIATGTPSLAMTKNDPATALIFEAITRSFGEDVPLKGPERVLHRVQNKIRRLKTPGAKLRSIAQASDELKLYYLETSARIDQMEHNGEIDDPVVCYGYLERIKLMIRRLELLGNKVGQVSMEAEETTTTSTEMKSIPLIPHGESIEQRDAPEFMDVEELAAFLRVSPSTIYHRTRNGAIPTRRIGERLLFSREEIKTWLASSKYGVASIS